MKCKRSGAFVRLDQITPDITMDDFEANKIDSKELSVDAQIAKGGFGEAEMHGWY